MLQKGEAIQGRTLIQYEIFQQAVFLDREVYRRTVTKRPVAGRVETQVATAQGSRGSLRSNPPQKSFDTCFQFLKAKRFDQVIVCPG